MLNDAVASYLLLERLVAFHQLAPCLMYRKHCNLLLVSIRQHVYHYVESSMESQSGMLNVSSHFLQVLKGTKRYALALPYCEVSSSSVRNFTTDLLFLHSRQTAMIGHVCTDAVVMSWLEARQP